MTSWKHLSWGKHKLSACFQGKREGSHELASRRGNRSDLGSVRESELWPACQYRRVMQHSKAGMLGQGFGSWQARGLDRCQMAGSVESGRFCLASATVVMIIPTNLSRMKRLPVNLVPSVEDE
jgi:hypothetical protein